MSTSAKVRSWLIDSARPVLKPIGASIIFRHFDQLAGIALLAIGAGAVTKAAATALHSPHTGPDWLPHTITSLAIVLVALSLLKGVVHYLEQFYAHLVAFKALEILRVKLYRALVPQTPALMQRSTSGDLLTRATKDIDRIEVFFAHTFPPAVTAITIPIIGVIGLGATISWQLALGAALGLIVSLVIPIVGSRASMSSSVQGAAARGRISQHVTDSVQGMAEITGYGHTSHRLDELAQLDHQVGQAQTRRGLIQGLRDAAQVITVSLSVVVTALIANAQDIDLVSTAIAITVVWKLFDSTAAVKDFMASLDTSMAAAERVYQITTAEPLVADPSDPRDLAAGPVSVSWQNLTYTYPSKATGREAAVRNVSIDVPAGSHCLLTGHSGCGKSTLLQLALRYDDPQSGKVLISGHDARDLAQDQLRQRIAMVSQSTFLFHGSIIDNLRIASPDASDAEIKEVVRITQLADEIATFPNGLDTQIGEQGQKLSGGQQQRLALARALLTNADVFLLDEFTSHLNPELADRVRYALREARPNVTIIESAHLDSSVQADQIIRMDAGQVVATTR